MTINYLVISKPTKIKTKGEKIYGKVCSKQGNNRNNSKELS